jgi:hypothetical protein
MDAGAQHHQTDSDAGKRSLEFLMKEFQQVSSTVLHAMSNEACSTLRGLNPC